MSDEKQLPPCDPEVFEKGESIGLFPGIKKEDIERLCKSLSAVTGWRIDWSYFAGRPHVRALAPADQYPGLATAWFDPSYQEFITAQGREATLRIGDGDRLARYSVPLFTGAQAGEVVALRSSLLRAGEREHELRTELVELRAALKFYADRDHYSTDDGLNWDSCSGEPANILWHESEPWFIEDGSIARAALESKGPKCKACGDTGTIDDASKDELPGGLCVERGLVACAACESLDEPTDLATWKRRAIEAESKLRTYDPQVVDLGERAMQALLAEPTPKELVLTKCKLCDQLQADITERDERIDQLRSGYVFETGPYQVEMSEDQWSAALGVFENYNMGDDKHFVFLEEQGRGVISEILIEIGVARAPDADEVAE